MAAHAEVDESIRHIRAVSRRLRAELASLPPEAWDAPSNCPPWPVRRLMAHAVNNAEFVQLNVERGVAGLTEPGITTEERAKRVQEILQDKIFLENSGQLQVRGTNPGDAARRAMLTDISDAGGGE